MNRDAKNAKLRGGRFGYNVQWYSGGIVWKWDAFGRLCLRAKLARIERRELDND